MYCPSCKDEFRSGFTRCQSCDVDLVEDLSSLPPERLAAGAGGEEATVPRAVPMADYCGFFRLDEARGAREQLKAEGISSDIVIRTSPDASDQNAFGEEYWLRVEAAKYRMAAPVLGFDSADAGGTAKSTNCESCGDKVSVEATFCAKCGTRFEAP